MCFAACLKPPTTFLASLLRAHAAVVPPSLEEGVRHWCIVPSISLQVCTLLVNSFSLEDISGSLGCVECLSWVLSFPFSHLGTCGSVGGMCECLSMSAPPPPRWRRWTCGQWVLSLHPYGGRDIQTSASKGQSRGWTHGGSQMGFSRGAGAYQISTLPS